MLFRSKKFTSDINVVQGRDLNFVLRSEIFVHYDGQLRASQLILGYTSVYMSYQISRQDLTVGSPLLSYRDVQYRGFFPLNLTIDEARDLNPQLIRVGSLVPVRDRSANSVFQGRAVHTPVEEPCIEVQAS